MRESKTTTAVMVAICVAPLTLFAEEGSGRLGPNFLHVEPDTGTLLVLCEKSDSIARIDVRTGAFLAESDIGVAPFAVCAHPSNNRLYVSCRRGQEVVELDASSLGVKRRFSVLGDPTGLTVSGDGTRLYVGVHSLDQLAVFDLESGEEIKRLSVGNGPEMVRLVPGKGQVYVTHLLSNPVRADQPCRNEVTVIDDATGRIVDRIILENANVGRWIDFTADEMLGVVVISRPKNLVPMVQVARGWVVTNGFALLGAEAAGEPVQLLVDLPNEGFADPYGVVFAADDRKFYLTASGVDTVVVVDVGRVGTVLSEVGEDDLTDLANHLGVSRRYVTARIPVGANPMALAASDDGRWVYVANRLDDSISVIDTTTDRVVRTLVLGDPPPADRLHRGERFFHSSAKTFQRQFACVSCHPDGGFDGLVYDLEPDGLGENIVDNRNMRDVVDTGPFKWVGTNPDISTQCGTRTAKWIVRTGWLSSTGVVDLSNYIKSIPPVVNPYRSPDGRLTAAQRRGKALFDRTTLNDGTPMARKDQCAFCHAGPKFTDGRRSDVGTKGSGDTKTAFDTAHLNNIFESGPYLHDGRAATLEEIWTKYNLDDRHGISSDWTKQQLNDLVEYLKCL